MIKKITLIFCLLSTSLAPLTSMAQVGASASASAAAAAYAKARASDAIGVPVSSEAGALSAGSGAGTKTQTISNWLETFVRTTLKKALLDRLVDQIINYIQGGGKPMFVTDWKGFLADAGNQAVGEFALSLSSATAALCSPFKLQVQLNLLPVQKFSKQAECTLDKIVGNIKNFYSDFRTGGWLAYSEAWQPQNNYFGLLLMTTAESERRRGLAESAALNEAQAGAGYLSKKVNGLITLPGSTAKDLVGEAVTSDIKFLLTAEQLGEYASAITNALVNRVLKEGITGVQTAISGNSQQTAIDQYNQLITNNFNTLRNTLLAQIDATIGPRQQSNSIIDITIKNSTQYKIDLQKLFNDFTATGKTICSNQNSQQQSVNVAQTKQAITSEITNSTNSVIQLQATEQENKLLITDLQNRRLEIEKLQRDNAGLIRLQSIEQETAGVADIAGAENFFKGIQDQSVANDQNVASQLANFNQKLQQCRVN